MPSWLDLNINKSFSFFVYRSILLFKLLQASSRRYETYETVGGLEAVLTDRDVASIC
jgi:hypothetical protein